MNRFIIGIIAALAITTPALAQVDFPTNNPAVNSRGGTVMCLDTNGTSWGASSTNPCPVTVVSGSAGKTVSVCVAPTVSNTTYAANVVVGGLLTFSSLFPAAGGGVVESVSLQFTTAQTVGFLFFPFSSNPSASTWTDHSAAAINSADVLKVRGPVPLTIPYSNLGTQTVYAQDAIGKALNVGGTTMYGILVPTGTTASLGGTTGVVQVCVKVLQDG